MVDAQRGVPRIAVGRGTGGVHALLAGGAVGSGVVPAFAGRPLGTVRLTGRSPPGEGLLPAVDRVVHGVCAGDDDGGAEPPVPDVRTGVGYSGPGGRS